MIQLNGTDLSLEEVARAARKLEKVAISEPAQLAVCRARALVDEKCKSGAVVYGLTTGFGKFADKRIENGDTEALQRNLIVSHACGTGDPLPADAVRAVMLLRLNALARGYSGIRLSTMETLLAMLNSGVHPVIPEKGSLGASGDLVPLAHMVLPMIGEGEAEFGGEVLPGAEAMRRAGIPLVKLAAKEGLALINGTQVMTAVGALAVWDALQLLKTADVIAAMTCEAQTCITGAFDARIHALRAHPGQIASAENLRKLLCGSGYCGETVAGKVQDAYSIRCIPQVHGASRDAVFYVRDAVLREINAVTDNPLIFPEDGDVISGGNFHGQPMALAFDFLGIALAELANISERRTERLVNPYLNNGLPAFLTPNGGLNSGFMIAQYAAAALVSENKILAHPASVDSIPSSANQEDHVSMGTIAARKAASILGNASRVLAIELFAAGQAISLAGEDKLAPATKEAFGVLRREVPFIEHDTVMHEQMAKCERIVKSGKLISAAEAVCGELN
ncbi:MAG TPA: histidine ammonia-lyase [Eubacteriales bacterium]|nr:histidine ammonia-lyase [Eubacteriales bacterium]